MPKSKPHIKRRKTKAKHNRESGIIKGYMPSEGKEYCRQKLGMKRILSAKAGNEKEPVIADAPRWRQKT